MRHALGPGQVDNMYFWRSLLQRRPELFGSNTSKQLRERAEELAKGLVDVAFKVKFKKELRVLKAKYLKR